jgi:hypothetical protein
MAFDENWQIARNPATIVYTCECYVDDANKFIGAFTCYHKSLDVLVKEYFFNNDVLHGSVKEFYLSGQIKLNAEYDNGGPVNEWMEYDEKGALVLERVFPDKTVLNEAYVLGTTPYDKAMAFSHKKEELPIYTSDCIRLKIEDQRYSCSDAAILKYLGNPPLPEVLKSDPAYLGKTFECVLLYTLSAKGIVNTVEIIKSTGDAFLDLLAEAHVLNMVPFESAKQYGLPIPYNLEAQIIFIF